ncbi:MAG: hypothetical protein PHS93_09080 [Candidatus Omnitrophica bacterium]|nr:hypothetical protein [Candidatus Omnitrophota bacterium]MDD5551290.1 hypothetical protein [Candidatus Omnitrophota bacterium]
MKIIDNFFERRIGKRFIGLGMKMFPFIHMWTNKDGRFGITLSDDWGYIKKIEELGKKTNKVDEYL